MDPGHERDEQQQRGDHHVPGQHVGEEPDHERERLAEQAEDLHRDHDREQPGRHPRRHQPDEMVDEAELADPRPLLGEERHRGQREGDGDVPGGSGGERHQAQQRRHEDEEEEAQEQRGEAPAVVADVLLGDVVAHEEDHGLDGGRDPRGHSARAIVPPGELRDQDDDGGRAHEEDQVLGRAEVDPEGRERLIGHVVHQDLGGTVLFGVLGRSGGVLAGGGRRAVGGRLGFLAERPGQQQRGRDHHRAAARCDVRRWRTVSSKARKATK